MFRTLKNWMSGVVLFALIAAQVAPASALTISFDTEAAPLPPLRIVSTTIAQNETNVGYTPTIRVNFNRPLQNVGGVWIYYSGSDIPLADGSRSVGTDYMEFVVLPTTPLLPSTEYYLDILAKDPDGNYMDGSDPANSPYYVSGHIFRLYFTTAAGGAWISTDIGGNIMAATGGQSNVPITAVIKVTASKALQSSTINATNIKLYKGADGDMSTPVTINAPTLDGTGKIITVAPSSSLSYSSHYHLELINVADTLGNVLL